MISLFQIWGCSFCDEHSLKYFCVNICKFVIINQRICLIGLTISVSRNSKAPWLVYNIPAAFINQSAKMPEALQGQNWDCSANEISARTEKLIDVTRAVYDKVGSIPLDEVNYDNTIKPIADSDCSFAVERSKFCHTLFPLSFIQFLINVDISGTTWISTSIFTHAKNSEMPAPLPIKNCRILKLNWAWDKISTTGSLNPIIKFLRWWCHFKRWLMKRVLNFQGCGRESNPRFKVFHWRKKTNWKDD